MLLQSGLTERWWTLAIQHWAMCYIASHEDSHGRTPSYMKFGDRAPFKVYPFGSLVMFKPPKEHPVSKVEAGKKETKKWRSRLVPSIFTGVSQGPGITWAQSYMIVPLAAIMSEGRASRVSIRTVADVVFPQAKVAVVAGGGHELLRHRFFYAAACFMGMRAILKSTAGNKRAELDVITIDFFQ